MKRVKSLCYDEEPMKLYRPEPTVLLDSIPLHKKLSSDWVVAQLEKKQHFVLHL